MKEEYLLFLQNRGNNDDDESNEPYYEPKRD